MLSILRQLILRAFAVHVYPEDDCSEKNWAIPATTCVCRLSCRDRNVHIGLGEDYLIYGLIFIFAELALAQLLTL